MENKQLYNIFNEDNEVEKSNLSVEEVVDYANTVYYYEQQDNDESEVLSFQDAVALLSSNGQQVVPIYKKGGNINKENSEMVQNQNKQIAHHSEELNDALKGNDNIPAWVVGKVNRSATDLSDATHYLEGQKMELGGNINEYGIKEFLNGLNLSELPSNVSSYIETELLTDSDLELIDINDETFVRVKNVISEKYPKSLNDSKEEPISKSEEVVKYEKEISDLNELISIEDDSEIIARYEKEIADLKELIELIS